MDVSTFYAVFSATCFTLVGLWWGVTLRDTGWTGDPVRRRAIGGCATTLRLLATDKDPALLAIRVGAAAIYVLIALMGAFPGAADLLGLRPIQVEALLLVLLVALGHALVWHYLVSDQRAAQTP